MSDVRERMAPSPTGWIHVGTARTYFMSYLFARQQNGVNLLRIEDTDVKRTVEGGVQGIVEQLELLGIVADEGYGYGGDFGPYLQTDRLDIYKKYADKLLVDGNAYRCFCSEERLAELKDRQTKSKEKRMYDGTCRHLSEEEIKQNLDAGMEYTIRMRIPENETIEAYDEIQGKLAFNSNDINDQVIVKANGIPTYHLAVVVDDHLMKITHMRRGVEWISSTPKQVLLYRYLGWEMPKLYQVPLLLNETGKGKLSKRKGDVAVLDFFRKGYIKEGFINYLMLVGWSPAPDVAREDEIYDLEFFIKNFDNSRIKKSSGRFQTAKMLSMNATWIARLSTSDLLDRFKTWYDIVLKETVVDRMRGEVEWVEELRVNARAIKEYFETDEDRAKALLELIQQRIKLLPEAFDYLSAVLEKIPTYDYEALDKKFPDIEKRKEIAYNLRVELENLNSWDQESWESTIRSLADKYELKHGDLFMLLRIVVTGKKVSPPLRELMEIVGRDFIWNRFESFQK